jgi:hypothetical protein
MKDPSGTYGGINLKCKYEIACLCRPTQAMVWTTLSNCWCGDVIDVVDLWKGKSGVGLFLTQHKNLLTLWDTSGWISSQLVMKVSKTAIIWQFWCLPDCQLMVGRLLGRIHALLPLKRRNNDLPTHELLLQSGEFCAVETFCEEVAQLLVRANFY